MIPDHWKDCKTDVQREDFMERTRKRQFESQKLNWAKSRKVSPRNFKSSGKFDGICIDCNRMIRVGDGRFNFPNGTRCTKCGTKIDDLKIEGLKLLKKYRELTGY